MQSLFVLVTDFLESAYNALLQATQVGDEAAYYRIVEEADRRVPGSVPVLLQKLSPVAYELTYGLKGCK